jgi:hypothetical protein
LMAQHRSISGGCLWVSHTVTKKVVRCAVRFRAPLPSTNECDQRGLNADADASCPLALAAGCSPSTWPHGTGTVHPARYELQGSGAKVHRHVLGRCNKRADDVKPSDVVGAKGPLGIDCPSSTDVMAHTHVVTDQLIWLNRPGHRLAHGNQTTGGRSGYPEHFGLILVDSAVSRVAVCGRVAVGAAYAELQQLSAADMRCSGVTLTTQRYECSGLSRRKPQRRHYVNGTAQPLASACAKALRYRIRPLLQRV